MISDAPWGGRGSSGANSSKYVSYKTEVKAYFKPEFSKGENYVHPKQNIVAGIKHLKYLMTLYPDNLKHVLAAYNAGENAVNKYNGIPPYRETQGYVKKVMKHFKRFQLASR